MKKKLLLTFALLATHNMFGMESVNIAAANHALYVIPGIFGVAPSNIQTVKRTNIRNGEGYIATLTNGNMLSAYKPQNQQPQCLLTQGVFMTPMTDRNSLYYFCCLKELYRQQQPQE